MKVSAETKALNAQVANILQVKGVTMTWTATGRDLTDPRRAPFTYLVTFSGAKIGNWQTPYTKGEAHVTDGKKDFGGRMYGQQPIPPMHAEVISALMMDASCVNGNTFEDFCSDMGYDTDSRKALETYLACQETENKLRRMLDRETLDQLSNLLGDY